MTYRMEGHGRASEGEAAMPLPLTWVLRNLQHRHHGGDTGDCAAEVYHEIAFRMGPGINMMYIPVYKRKSSVLQTPWLFINFVNSAAARRAIPLLDKQRWRGTGRVIQAKPAYVQGLQGNLALHSEDGVNVEHTLFLFDPEGNPIDMPTAIALYGPFHNGVQYGLVPGASQLMAMGPRKPHHKGVQHCLAPGEDQYIQSKTWTASPPAPSTLNDMIRLYGFPAHPA